MDILGVPTRKTALDGLWLGVALAGLGSAVWQSTLWHLCFVVPFLWTRWLDFQQARAYGAIVKRLQGTQRQGDIHEWLQEEKARVYGSDVSCLRGLEDGTVWANYSRAFETAAAFRPEADELFPRLDALTAELNDLRPLSWEALQSVSHFLNVELTWSSNAIEGSQMSREATDALLGTDVVLAKSRLTDALDAVGHGRAVDLAFRELIHTGASTRGSPPLTIANLQQLHRQILLSHSAVAPSSSDAPSSSQLAPRRV